MLHEFIVFYRTLLMLDCCLTLWHQSREMAYSIKIADLKRVLGCLLLRRGQFYLWIIHVTGLSQVWIRWHRDVWRLRLILLIILEVRMPGWHQAVILLLGTQVVEHRNVLGDIVLLGCRLIALRANVSFIWSSTTVIPSEVILYWLLGRV